MRMVDLIEKKRDGGTLSQEEIEFIIENYTKGIIPDYQMSAFTMAVFFKGMTDIESTYLAMAMLNSGDKMDLSSIPGIKVDKHSTGGVGDKASLVIGPLCASLGIKVAKMSGRGLGHTGGTLDKLESVPGVTISRTDEEFLEQVRNIGLAIVGQTGNLTPADKKLYALRDVTATVDSIPLIASSIMSKKLASGADVICLDVKVGSGAFMKDVESATHLAELMCAIGRNCGRKMTAVLTDMDEPLGCAVGNNLEVIEAINTLNGHGPEDFHKEVIEVSKFLVYDAGLASSLDEAKELLERQIANGEGLEKLADMIEAQGGSREYIYNPELFEKSKNVIPVYATESGIVSKINALEIGLSSMILGGGRETMEDTVDPAVGIVLNKKIGNKVESGDILAYVHSNGKNEDECLRRVKDAFVIGNETVEKKIILKVIR